MKKKLTAIFLCVALVAIAIVGASLAYFTDTKTATNTFTMGDVKIKLDETNVNDPEGDRVASNEYNVYPGAVVTKDPIVHNVGQNAAYIRATVNEEKLMQELKSQPHVVVLDVENLAKENHMPKSANVILLGAAAPFLKILDAEVLRESVGRIFASKGEEVVQMNYRAFDIGHEYVKQLKF